MQTLWHYTFNGLRFHSAYKPTCEGASDVQEYRLVPVEELADDDAGKVKDGIIEGQRERIAELEKQLAERDNRLTLARGDVEVYRKQLASASIRLENIALANAPRTEAEQLAERSPSVMPEEVRRLIDAGEEILSQESVEYGRAKTWTNAAKAVEAYFAPPFKFTGELGWYEFKSTLGTGRMETVARADGSLVGIYDVGHIDINADGTFPGGRITGRAG